MSQKHQYTGFFSSSGYSFRARICDRKVIAMSSTALDVYGKKVYLDEEIQRKLAKKLEAELDREVEFHPEGYILQSQKTVRLRDMEYRVWYEHNGNVVRVISAIMEYDDGYGQVDLRLPENSQVLKQVIDLLNEADSKLRDRLLREETW